MPWRPAIAGQPLTATRAARTTRTAEGWGGAAPNCDLIQDRHLFGQEILLVCGHIEAGLCAVKQVFEEARIGAHGHFRHEPGKHVKATDMVKVAMVVVSDGVGNCGGCRTNSSYASQAASQARSHGCTRCRPRSSASASPACTSLVTGESAVARLCIQDAPSGVRAVGTTCQAPRATEDRSGYRSDQRSIGLTQRLPARHRECSASAPTGPLRCGRLCSTTTSPLATRARAARCWRNIPLA